jgi:hypothetical protein
MTFATRKTLQAIKRKTSTVDVEGQTFRLQEMSGTERDRFEMAAFKEEGGKRTVDPLYLRARLVAICWVGENGKREYGDEDIAALSDELPASVIAKLFEAAQKLNGLDAVAVDDAAKNSESGPPAASTSG